ncbi:MAG TPA: hypothetical protein VFL59_13470 [Candidatus Nanopelagicales bacterium]|nr:hypothetical protein [Candidatus Nanopelagicales bacterium]
MSVVWHGVPQRMVGHTVVPLGRLRSVDPALYETQRAKYVGREAVLDYQIPLLGCGFLDTVHCSSIHPHRIFRARHDAGVEATSRSATGWGIGLAFEIPLARIMVNPTAWYSWRTPWVNGYPYEEVPAEPPGDEFEEFDPDRYSPLTDVPDRHRQYLARMREEGRQPLTFVHIPHVLVAGPVDIRGCRIVRWEDPVEP